MNTSINSFETANIAEIANDIIVDGVNQASWMHIMSASFQDFVRGAEVASQVLHADEQGRLNFVLTARSERRLVEAAFIADMEEFERQAEPDFEIAY